MLQETKREIVRKMAWDIARSYKLRSEFNTDFLADMIQSKYWNPEEGTLSIADKTGRKMKSINKKGNRIIDSTALKNLERLEAELDESPKVKTEHGRGFLVRNIVKIEADSIKAVIDCQ